jgi:hypothetical protein
MLKLFLTENNEHYGTEKKRNEGRIPCADAS